MTNLYIEILEDDQLKEIIDAIKEGLQNTNVGEITTSQILAKLCNDDLLMASNRIDINILLAITYEQLLDELLMHLLEVDDAEYDLTGNFALLINEYQLCEFLKLNKLRFSSSLLSSFETKFIHKVKLLKSLMVNNGVIQEQVVDHLFNC